MKTKILIAAMTIVMGSAGFAPSELEAKPKKYKKAINKAYKQDHKFHKEMAKKHYKRYHKPVKIEYKTPKYERESFGIYTTPTGGLGLHYSEHETRYRRPSYGFNPYYGVAPYGGYREVGGYGINIGF